MTDVKEVAEICARFQGACRAMHLYPPGHSMIESRMQPLASALTIFLSRHDSLPLQVEESTLLYRGEEVFRQEELRDDIAFMLFREGVRVLTLHAGLEQEELNTLVDCFSRHPKRPRWAKISSHCCGRRTFPTSSTSWSIRFGWRCPTRVGSKP